MTEAVDALVIGAGPAGLMAAEVMAGAGRRVVVADAMPTVARKFLMAGKSGLNITRLEPLQDFARRFGGGGDTLPPHPRGYFGSGDAAFGPEAVMAWARGLGIELFAGSTGRVFPVGMKASPLLRAWLARLRASGVEIRTRWRWDGLEGGFQFQTPEGRRVLTARSTVLALGGGSWPRLGSDAGWLPILRRAGVEVTDFAPANMGFHVDWSAAMAPFFGAAVKGVAIHAAGRVGRGEWVITRDGIEGGGIYEVAAEIRDGAPAHLDLAPDLQISALAERFLRPGPKQSVGNRLRRVLGDPVRAALMLEWGRPLPPPADPGAWAARAKALPLRHKGPAPLDRAISSAGGIAWRSVGPDLGLRALPGVFVAGEMLDWEAPTGGYLLTACLAMGRLAGLAASAHH